MATFTVLLFGRTVKPCEVKALEDAIDHSHTNMVQIEAVRSHSIKIVNLDDNDNRPINNILQQYLQSIKTCINQVSYNERSQTTYGVLENAGGFNKDLQNNAADKVRKLF